MSARCWASARKRSAPMPGQAFHLKPPYPCHYYMHGSGRFGLQCLTNLDLLPPTGAVIIAAPLKIKEGSGSPLRVLALVPDVSAPPTARHAGRHAKRKGPGEPRRNADERRRHPGRISARRAHAAGDAATPGAPLRQPAVVRGRRRELELCGSAGHRGALCRHACRGGHSARRSRGADVLQPRRIHGGFLGCAWLGAIAVPLNVAARGPQLAHMLRNSGARLLHHRGANCCDALDLYRHRQDLALERIWLHWRRTRVASGRSSR